MNATAILTKREAEIAELLAWGAAKKEVANTLYISTRTVENTARNIYEKVGAQKATELCVWWFCAKCGVPWEISPIKRIIAIILLTAFIQCNIFEDQKYERFFRRIGRTERIERRRIEEDNELEYLLT